MDACGGACGGSTNSAWWKWTPGESGLEVQWDTSEHDWTEGRGQKMYLVSMIERDPLRTDSHYQATWERNSPTGHFCFPGNRTFLFCRDTTSCLSSPTFVPIILK